MSGMQTRVIGNNTYVSSTDGFWITGNNPNSFVNCYAENGPYIVETALGMVLLRKRDALDNRKVVAAHVFSSLDSPKYPVVAAEFKQKARWMNFVAKRFPRYR